MKTIAPYVAGGALISVGAGGVGALVLIYGVLRDWRFWLLGVVSFMIGLNIGR